MTGGSSVGFARSRDLKTWEPYHVAMSQQANLTDRGEYQIAPYAPRPAQEPSLLQKPSSTRAGAQIVACTIVISTTDEVVRREQMRV